MSTAALVAGSPADKNIRDTATELAIPLIELRNIHRTFVTGGGVEVHALRGINLKIYTSH